MRHGRQRRRLGLVAEHRRALLRNLAKGLIDSQKIVTTHARAKEASRFVDGLVTIAKENTLHARRRLIGELGSGSEHYAKRMVETIAPKFAGRQGGYTRVLHYRTRPGDGAALSLLEFSAPVPELEKKKKPKKEKREPEQKAIVEEKPAAKEAPKKGGFLSKLRRFLKGDDEQGKK